MDKKYLYEIESIFDEKEAKEEAVRKKEKSKRDEEERRLQNFFYKRETIYKPLFESIKKIVEDRGFVCTIENETEEESVHPQIRITFTENEKENEQDASAAEAVYFAIIFDKINNQIFIHENAGNGLRTKSGPVKYDIEGLTEEFLSMRLVKLIKDMVLK